jgi:hypothetical protein
VVLGPEASSVDGLQIPLALDGQVRPNIDARSVDCRVPNQVLCGETGGPVPSEKGLVSRGLAIEVDHVGWQRQVSTGPSVTEEYPSDEDGEDCEDEHRGREREMVCDKKKKSGEKDFCAHTMGEEARETPGVGGILQTLTLGPQDKRLYTLDTPGCNPFTTTPTIRTTRGAIEVKEQAFSPFRFDAINRIELQRAGDLLGDITLEITLPSLFNRGGRGDEYWKPNIGYIIIRHIRLLLNDTELNSSERLYYDLYEQLYEPDSTRRAIRAMIGGEEPDQLQINREHTILIPLKLFTSKRRGRQTFMPLISTPVSSLYLEIETEAFENCVTSYGGTDPPRTLECTILSEYVFLEDEEKERMINQPQTMLIETVADAEGFSYQEVLSVSGTNQIIATDRVIISLKEINFPVKAIMFAAYKTTDLQNRDYFQYIDVIESAAIRFDGNDRTEGSEPAQYYRLVQPYQHAPRCVNDNIFFYSFALDPSLLQPSGSFTFSNIREGDIMIKLKTKASDVVVKAFVIGYTWVQFKNGFATTLFT